VIDPPSEIPNGSTYRRVWQWPDCPGCRLDVFVCHSGEDNATEPYRCVNPFCETGSFTDQRWSEVEYAD
jgi:hypothetical protein